MASPPYNLDISDPTDGSLGSAFPANERTFRDNVNSYLNTEHDINTGYHKFQELTTAQRTALTSPPNGMIVYTTDASPIGLYINTGSAGAPVWTLIIPSAITNFTTAFQASGIGLQTDFITATGSYTILAKKIEVSFIGAGGAACGSGAASPGNGGSGAYGMKYLSGLTIGATLSITVGTGGAGQGTGMSGGPAGSSTVVASGTQVITTLTAPGGSGGISSANGAGAATSTNGDINSIGNGGTSVGGGLIGPFGSSYGSGGLVNTTLYSTGAGGGANGLVVIRSIA